MQSVSRVAGGAVRPVGRVYLPIVGLIHNPWGPYIGLPGDSRGSVPAGRKGASSGHHLAPGRYMGCHSGKRIDPSAKLIKV